MDLLYFPKFLSKYISSERFCSSVEDCNTVLRPLSKPVERFHTKNLSHKIFKKKYFCVAQKLLIHSLLFQINISFKMIFSFLEKFYLITDKILFDYGYMWSCSPCSETNAELLILKKDAPKFSIIDNVNKQIGIIETQRKYLSKALHTLTERRIL